MKLRSVYIILLTFILSSVLNGSDINTRPCELQFYVESHLSSTVKIEYNKNGYVIKMSSFSSGRLTDYSRYKYNPENRLMLERSYDPSGILIKTRRYYYNETGLIYGEEVYSPQEILLEYVRINYTDNKIDKVSYYKPGNILFQTIDFRYKNGLTDLIIFNKTDKYIMIMKPVYDERMRLIGHNIKHSNTDVKIETKYIYEEGYASEETIRLIFR